MNKVDWKFLKERTKKAEENVKFYKGLTDGDYKRDIRFWEGHLNALNLMWLSAKNNHKFLN
jgi:hypothetical protein